MTLSSLLKPSTKPMTLRATGAGVKTINLLPPSLTGCLSLYISYNSISSLENISQFKNLKALLMDFNEISRIEELEPLSTLKNLTILHIEGNPVCDLPLWDFHLMTFCPKIRVLNGQKTKDFLYSKSQIHHFLELESKFYQFIITAKYVIRVLKLKMINSSLDFPLAAKITQRTMFKDPNFQSNYVNNLRVQCAKVSVDGYFSFMRRKLLTQHQKISQLSKMLDEPSRSHTILLEQIKLYTDFDAFLESMQDLQDSSLQVVGLGTGPIVVVQQKQEPFFSSRRSLIPKSDRSDYQSNLQQTSSVIDQIYPIEDYHPNNEGPGGQTITNILITEEEEEILDDNFEQTSISNKMNANNTNINDVEIEINLEIDAEDEAKKNKRYQKESNTQNTNDAAEAKISLLSESGSQLDTSLKPTNQSNQPSFANSSKATRSAANSVTDIQAPETAFSESFAPNKRSLKKKIPDNDVLSEPPDTPETRKKAQKSKEEFDLQFKNQKQENNSTKNNELLSEGSYDSLSNKKTGNKKEEEIKKLKNQNQNLNENNSTKDSSNLGSENIQDQNKTNEELQNKINYLDPTNQGQNIEDGNVSQNDNENPKLNGNEDPKTDNQNSKSDNKDSIQISPSTNQENIISRDTQGANQYPSAIEEEEEEEIGYGSQIGKDNLFQKPFEHEMDKINTILFDDEKEEENQNKLMSDKAEPKKEEGEIKEEPNQLEMKPQQKERNEEEELTDDKSKSSSNSNQPEILIPRDLNENQNNFQFEIEEEGKNENEKININRSKKSKRSSKKKTFKIISDADTDYAQSLSDTDTPGRPSALNSKKKELTQSEDPFIFEKSKSKSSFKSLENYPSDSSISNELRSILRYPNVKTENEPDTPKVSLAISKPNVNEKELLSEKNLANPSSVNFEASSDKSSEFIDVRTPTIKMNLVPIDLLSKSFTIWKNRFKKLSKEPDLEFVRYIRLLDQLDDTKSAIKKEKKVQLRASCKHETQRGDQLRQISLKQELKRKIEHQKDINRALQKRLNQYMSENESLQGFLDSPSDKSFSNSFSMSFIQSSQSSKTKKKKKDSLTAQYCAMLREKK